MSPRWNPPEWAVRRWIEMCMERWRNHSKPGRVICLNPLNMLDETQAADRLAQYIGEAREWVEQMFEDPDKQEHRERVDTIIIPVRWAGVWSLYYTMRLAHAQGVIRVAEMHHKEK